MTDTAEHPAVHPWVAAGHDRVRFGLFGGPWADWPALRDLVQLAEDLGFDAYWMADHPLRYPECWTQLAALAVTTHTIRLGSLVSNVLYRRPTLLARVAADIDRLSGGRLVLGLGVGDNRQELREMAVAMPAMAERQAALAETVHIVRGLWGDAPFTFEGRHFQVYDARVTPPPVQQPSVPLLIGGGGEQGTLWQVAQFADACNVGAPLHAGSVFTLDDVRRKLDVLRRHCAAVGRPYEAILRTNWSGYVVCATDERAAQAKYDRLPADIRHDWAASLVVGTPRRLVEHYQALVDVGMQYFTVVIYERDIETVRLLAEQVMPRVVARPWT